INNISILIGVCLLISINILSGQGIQFDHYAVRDGISQSEVLCIFQDSEGYMWFGTQNGLNKFDGYSFEKYFSDPSDINTISSGWIFNITEDDNGFLWIGTKGGLNKFDKKTGSFTRVNTIDGNLADNTNFIYGITSDSSNIYVNHLSILSILNFNTGSLESYTNTFERERALYDVGFPIITDSKGLIWMGSLNGLSSFDLHDKRFNNYTHSESDPGTISHNHITALFEDKRGNILIGTENGLNIYNIKTKKIIRYYQDNNRPGNLSHNYIRSITQDHTGAIWIGTDGGGLNKMTYSVPTGSAGFIHFRSGPDQTYSISHDIVYSLYEDTSNNLWIGTIAGIDKTDLKKKSIRTYMKSDNPNSINLLDNVIASVYQDSDGKLWIGNWGKGLNILDRGTNEVIHYTSELTGRTHIPQNHVHVIFEDSKSRIWLGTRNGVSIFDKNSNLFIPVQDYFKTPDFNYFNNNRVYCIVEDSRGKIWIGTGNGIIILNTETKSSTLIQTGNETAWTITSNLVYSLLEDKDQNIWIATSNGLNKYVPSENRVYYYVNNPDSSNTLCDNYVISLCEDRTGNIWIGASTGINRFDKADSVFSHYTIKDGLPSNIIYDIIKDGNENLWFSTGSGLAMKNPDENALETFLVEDKFLGKEFNLKAVFKADDGEMFFGGIDGLISFYPDSLMDNNYIPPIRITSLDKEKNGIRQEINPYSDRIFLSYRDYSFTIKFSALDFTNPDKNRYSYQMEGISDNWIEIGNRRFVQFTKLPPGEYTFNVKGTNNDGVWNNAGASIKITISPPWWRSNYAYIFYIIFIIAIIIIVIRTREKSLIREKKILEEKIRERTSEIAQQKEMVEESEAKLSSTISSIDDLVFVLDKSGIFQEFYNQGKYKTLYSEAESYIGKHFKNVGFPELIVQKLTNAFSKLMHKGSFEEFDYSLEKKDKTFWFNAKISPRRNVKGALSGITIVARDITGRKQSEEQLKKLNTTKDTFFSILAHDLKNPFSSLHSMSEMMIDNYQNLEEKEKMMALKNIHKSAEQIFNLLKNLLTWSNSQRGRIEYSPEKFNISSLIQVNMNLIKLPAEKKGVVLTTNITDDLPAYGDREMINTVIRNLINNAVKFSNKGGTVEVKVHDKNKLFEVIVSDDGVGIPVENVKKLFHIDQKYKSVGTAGESGTGLGLVLCKEFIDKNGGEIWCKTKEGSWTEFHFTIPKYTDSDLKIIQD
ncbi:MAG: PAS domain S-box protein, partial [Bacteroidetes bacterium]|nr:PAS domain S-box protein [Bacteroidota bacterium]